MIKFTRGDIDSWVEFSGDKNPIHSDASLVEANFGIPEVAVPGMLSMMVCKELLPTKDATSWLRWMAVIRRMIFVRDVCQLRQTPIAKGGRFSLSDATKECIGGNWGEVNVENSRFEVRERHRLENDFIAQRVQEFGKKFPHVRTPWVVLDAILFSVYLSKHFGESYKKKFPFLEASNAGNALVEMTRQYMVFQTYHESRVAPVLANMTELNASSSVEYAVVFAQPIPTKDGFFGRIELPVWIDGVLSLVSEVGISVKSFN
jgi:hypothetical protein